MEGSTKDAATPNTITNEPGKDAVNRGATSQNTTQAGNGAARPNRQLLAYALIVFGAVLLLTRLGGADWLWLALLGGVFLLGYVSRKNYGFLVAGGVLMGVAVGTLIGTQSGMLLSLAAGFFAIDRVEPKPNRWALYTAGIFAVLGAFGALSVTGLLSSVGFALALIAAGVYLLRDRQPRFPPQDTYQQDTYQRDAYQTTYSDAGTEHTVTKDTSTKDTYTPAQPPTTASTSAKPAPAVVPTTPAPTSPAPQEPVRTPANSQPAPEAAPAATAPTEPTAPPLSPEAEARLRRLEAWRRETAAAEGTPAYIVFSNDTLAKIAAAEPQTLGDLGGVKGVGPVKLERYGEAVLELVRGDAPPTRESSEVPETR